MATLISKVRHKVFDYRLEMDALGVIRSTPIPLRTYPFGQIEGQNDLQIQVCNLRNGNFTTYCKKIEEKNSCTAKRTFYDHTDKKITIMVCNKNIAKESRDISLQLF